MLEFGDGLQGNPTIHEQFVCVKDIAAIRRSQGKRYQCQCQEFQLIHFIFKKELAKRFALSFGLDAVKNREAIISLHRAGVLFAVQHNSELSDDPSAPPPNLLFLEILNEFTNKLLKQDKRVM